MSEPTLAQRLGYPADAKLLIINADDLGSCHSANVGVFECLATGRGHQRHAMVPCPWAREATAGTAGEDIGVHLTLNAEYELYRWGPDHPCSLLAGWRWRLSPNVGGRWDHADLDEVRRECRAQNERAILLGFRREPHRCAHGHLATPAGILRCLPRYGHRIQLAAAYGERPHGPLHRLPGPGGGERRRRCLPDHMLSCPVWAPARCSRKT